VKSRDLLAVMLFPVLGGASPGDPWTDVNRTVQVVVFHPVWRDGSSPEFRLISLRGRRGQDQVRHCQGGRCTGLPVDVYEYEIQLKGTGPKFKGKAALFHPQHWVTIPLEQAVDRPHSEGGRVIGRVAGLNMAGSPHWIRMTLAFSTGHTEVPLAPDGRFEFYSLVTGEYLLTVFGMGRVRMVKRVRLREAREVRIEFPFVEMAEQGRRSGCAGGDPGGGSLMARRHGVGAQVDGPEGRRG